MRAGPTQGWPFLLHCVIATTLVILSEAVLQAERRISVSTGLARKP
jgi:hypothetical protein